jgi:broad specificity phosphatase PhoE
MVNEFFVERDASFEQDRITRIHLVRHGTTLLNRQNRYRGRRDVALDQGGWDDAWGAARELADTDVAAVYSSPLRRARDTARIVADVAGVATVEDLPGLVNLEYGAWEGLTSDEAADRDPELFHRYQTYASDAFCPDGERLDDAAARVMLSLRLIAALHPGRSVAAVSHAAMVRLAIAATTGGPRENWRASLPNGSITVFDVVDDEVRLHRAPVPLG